MEALESRLAAVLAADVAGYSRLMQADARGTVAALDAARAVFRRHIADSGGRVVDMAGDSVLAIFELASKAVAAAVSIQDDLAAHNASVDRERRMEFRIGLHLGEVLSKADGTIYGDGVNIAARLESLAEVGGICASSVVHDVAAGNVDVPFTFAGEHEVKNIARPIGAWRVGSGAEGAAAARVARPDEPPSIAVLPFENMSGDPEQAYFSDGITEDIITDLSKVRGLLVIARNSSFAHRGKDQDLRAVAKELGVRYLLEGSVRKAGERVRVTTQLIDGTSGGHVWAERYDRQLEDIFAVQDEVTAAIVGELSGHLGQGRSDETRRHEMDVATWDIYLRGRAAAYNTTRAANDEGVALMRQVLERDPNNASAYAVLGFALTLRFLNGWGETSIEPAVAAIDRALALDPAEPHAHYSRAMLLLYSGRAAESRVAAEHALEIAPNQSASHAVMAGALLALGRADEAIEQYDIAMRLDPHYPSMWLHHVAMCHYIRGDYERCRALLEQRLAIAFDTDLSPLLLAATLARLGDPEAARKYWRRVFAVNPDFSMDRYRRTSLFQNVDRVEHMVEGLRMAGIDPEVAPARDGS